MENNKQPLTAEEIKDWSKPVDGIINVPDELDPLINKLAFQFQLYNLSKRFGEAEMLCRMTYIAQCFFSKLADEQTKPLKEEIERLRDVSTQHLLDYTESNVLLQEKVAELEASLSLAKKENEELRGTLIDVVEKHRNDVNNLSSELTSVKEQLQALKFEAVGFEGLVKAYEFEIDRLKQQNKELAEALDEVVIYLGDEKDFERAERFLIKKIKPALTNYKQTKP